MVDYTFELSDAQAITATAGSTNTFDAKAADHNTGIAGLRAHAVVHTAFASSGPIIQPALQDSADGSTWADIIDGQNSTTSAPADEILLDVGVPSDARRYLRFNYTLTGSASVGNITAYLYTTK